MRAATWVSKPWRWTACPALRSVRCGARSSSIGLETKHGMTLVEKTYKDLAISAATDSAVHNQTLEWPQQPQRATGKVRQADQAMGQG